jgi:hypothetical protein
MTNFDFVMTIALAAWQNFSGDQMEQRCAGSGQ